MEEVSKHETWLSEGLVGLCWTSELHEISIFPPIVNIFIDEKNWSYTLRGVESRIRALPAFELNDVHKLDPGFHRQQLNYWHNQG
jgi:hypothetical protein